MQKIIAALKNKGLAVEINDLAHTPHERFISMAKEQGLRFTFGSDTRDQKAGRLDFCRHIARRCGLKRDDFFLPARVLNGRDSSASGRSLPRSARTHAVRTPAMITGL